MFNNNVMIITISEWGSEGRARRASARGRRSERCGGLGAAPRGGAGGAGPRPAAPPGVRGGSGAQRIPGWRAAPLGSAGLRRHGGGGPGPRSSAGCGAGPGGVEGAERSAVLTPSLCPQLASAGTFRVVKEPLAFLRVLEWVSPAWGGMGRGGGVAVVVVVGSGGVSPR